MIVLPIQEDGAIYRSNSSGSMIYNIPGLDVPEEVEFGYTELFGFEKAQVVEPWSTYTPAVTHIDRPATIPSDFGHDWVTLVKYKAPCYRFYIDSIAWGGETYYDDSYDKTGMGTKDDPWRNLQHAIEKTGLLASCLSLNTCGIYVQLCIKGVVDYVPRGGGYQILSPWEQSSIVSPGDNGRGTVSGLPTWELTCAPDNYIVSSSFRAIIGCRSEGVTLAATMLYNCKVTKDERDMYGVCFKGRSIYHCEGVGYTDPKESPPRGKSIGAIAYPEHIGVVHSCKFMEGCYLGCRGGHIYNTSIHIDNQDYDYTAYRNPYGITQARIVHDCDVVLKGYSMQGIEARAVTGCRITMTGTEYGQYRAWAYGIRGCTIAENNVITASVHAVSAGTCTVDAIGLAGSLAGEFYSHGPHKYLETNTFNLTATIEPPLIMSYFWSWSKVVEVDGDTEPGRLTYGLGCDWWKMGRWSVPNPGGGTSDDYSGTRHYWCSTYDITS